MTAQINDIYTYRNERYSIAGISNGELFDPAMFDMQPVMASTACWRGYQVTYSLVEDRLVVSDLQVNLMEKDDEVSKRQEGPVINGVRPTGPRMDFDFFNNHYSNINYALDYSGGLLLAEGFIEELYVHMGFHPAWKYERVIELIFENGVLVDEFDRSEQMAEIREMIVGDDTEGSSSMPSDDAIRRFVEDAFDRSYSI